MFVVLSFILICVSILLEIYFALKGPLLRLINIVYLLYVYLLRPIAIISVGTSLLYPKEFDLNTYKLAWLLASVSIVCENIGYYLTFPRISRLRKEFSAHGSIGDLTRRFSKTERNIFWLAIFSFLSLSLMFLSAGTAFLAHNREVAMAAVNPILRYLYPFVQLSAALLGFIGLIQITILKKTFRGVITFLLGVVFTAIVYQRGMLISFVLLAFFLTLDLFRISQIVVEKKKIIKFLLAALILLVVLVLLRDIYNLIFSGQFLLLRLLEKREDGSPFMLLLISRPDGDTLEVWTILLRYISENTPLLGKSLLNIPFTLTSSNFRLLSGHKLGVDILNEYYDYDTYWYKKFGFNLNSAQEMVLNFSFAGIFFGFIMGLFKGILISWYYRKILFRSEPTKPTVYYQGLSYFLSTFSAFHWMVFYIVFAEVLGSLSRIRFMFKRSEKTPTYFVHKQVRSSE